MHIAGKDVPVRTRHVTDPTETRSMHVPVKQKCGICHKTPCGCVTVAQTTYTPVPVVQNVTVTTMVPETQTPEKTPVLGAIENPGPQAG